MSMSMTSERFGEVLGPAQEPIVARAEFGDPVAGGLPSFQADGGAQLVLATANPDKAAEILAIVGTSMRLVPRPLEIPDVEETGASLEDNAYLKAAAVSQATGLPAVADDTVLEVDALGGAPGLRSGRFAGEGASYADNVAKLLRMLDGMVGDQRRARVRTVALAYFPDATVVVGTGVVEGFITEAPRGTAGFGYDSVFVPTERDGRTFAEMTPEEKHVLFARGRAFRALIARLAAETPASHARKAQPSP